MLWETHTSGLVSASSGTHYRQGTQHEAVETTKVEEDPGLTAHSSLYCLKSQVAAGRQAWAPEGGGGKLGRKCCAEQMV